MRYDIHVNNCQSAAFTDCFNCSFCAWASGVSDTFHVPSDNNGFCQSAGAVSLTKYASLVSFEIARMQLQATEKERRENVMHSNTSGEESKSTRHRNNTWARMNKFGKAKLADDNATNPLKKDTQAAEITTELNGHVTIA